MLQGDEKNKKTILQYDELGFIVGMKRTEKSVNNINNNVEQIIKILHQLLQQQPPSDLKSRPQARLSAYQQAINEANNIKQQNSNDLVLERANSIIQAGVALDHVIRDFEDVIRESTNQSNENQKSHGASGIARDVVLIDSQESAQRQLGQRDRDKNGRFIGTTENPDSIIAKAADNISQAIKGTIGGTPQGVDPTLDAINEVATALSPVKRAAGFMLKPLSGFLKNRKRNEPIPKEQVNSNKEQSKLLKRISEKIGNSGGLSTILRMLPLILPAIAGIGAVIAAGFTAAAPVIAAAVGAAVTAWLVNKAKQKLDEIADKNRPENQGDVNPDGSSNKGIVGWLNRQSKGFMNGVRGTANQAIGNATGNYEFFDDGTGIDSKNRIGLRSDPVNQMGVLSGGKSTLEGENVAEKTKSLIRKHEGFRTKAYWDVNAYRIGYGSDTITDKNGKITKVTKNSTVNKEDAERDLVRRSQDFSSQARLKVGTANWDKLPDDTKAALTSVAYNYGSLPKRVVKAVQTGDLNKISESVRTLEVHNNGINKSRRNDEADIIKKSVLKNEVTSIPLTKNNSNMAGKVVTPQNTKDLADFSQNATVPNNVKPVIPMSNLSSRAKENISILSSVSPVQNLANQAITTNSARYNPPKMNTQIEPVKQRVSSPDPQKVLVVNQGGDNISQNVGDRDIAHAITGGIGERRNV